MSDTYRNRQGFGIPGKFMKPWGLALVTVLCAPAYAGVDIDVSAKEAALQANLRTRLSLANEPCDAPEWRVKRLYARVEKELGSTLRAFGYYRPTFDNKLRFDDDCWQADIRIQAGPRVNIRQRDVTIDGAANDDPALQPILAALPLSPGSPLHHNDYETIKAQLWNFAAERGYFDFQLTRQELRVYPEKDVADIIIHADSGERYRFGELNFSEHPLDDRLVRRLADIQPGTPFDARTLIALDRRLSDSGYFRRIDVQPRHEDARDHSIPVTIDLEPIPRHKWRAGIGYATDIGPRITLGYANRYLDGAGHQLDTEMRFSPVESGLTAEYVIPGDTPDRDRTIFGARLTHEDNDSAEFDNFTLSARRVHNTDDWTRTLFLELLHERSNLNGDIDQSTLLMPGITLTHTEVDNALRVEKGHRMHLEARAAHDSLLSTSSLVQVRANAKFIRRIGDAGRITGRVDAGLTLTDDISQLPTSLRFFAGGDNSVRGYAYKSLGPEDSNGDTIGGKHLLTLSAEYEHPVVNDDWWLAAFIDAGNAFDENDFDLKVGYGTGIRWYSPIGRVRLDFAVPEDNERDDWRLHFSLGVDL